MIICHEIGRRIFLKNTCAFHSIAHSVTNAIVAHLKKGTVKFISEMEIFVALSQGINFLPSIEIERREYEFPKTLRLPIIKIVVICIYIWRKGTSQGSLKYHKKCERHILAKSQNWKNSTVYPIHSPVSLGWAEVGRWTHRSLFWF